MFKGILSFLFLLTCFSAMSQSNDELQRISLKAKTLFVRPEVLDMLLIDLRKFETQPQREQDSLILDIYRTISSTYMANNHFKKAYVVYYKYLERKKAMLAAQKTKAIGNSTGSVTGRSQVDEQKEKELKNSLITLQVENQKLESNRLSFKSNFSLLLIVLTGIFAIMLVSAGVKIMNLNTSIQQSREKIKEMHRKAVIGKYSEGLRESFKTNIVSLAEQSGELNRMIKSHAQHEAVKNIGKRVELLDEAIRNLKSASNKVS